MIEINLLPGAGKKAQRKGGGGIALGAAFASLVANVKDPWLLGAVGSLGTAAAVVGLLFTWQGAKYDEVVEREQKAVQDSTRYAAVLREKDKAEAQRDSVIHQLEIIRSIDNNRFVWPHIMDEVSRSLPPYTWLTSMQQTSVTPAAIPAAPKPAAKGSKGKKAKEAEAADSASLKQPMRFRVVGNTVDIQALTRFMRVLETSPFIENVQLAGTVVVMEAGKEVTQFSIDAQYQQPDSASIRTIPLALSVR
jgi:Tfp pilus assembly protein PilN